MKKLLPLCALLTGMLCTLASCNNDDQPDILPGNGNVPEAILEQFKKQFPDAQNVTWENQADGYYTASFTTDDNPQSHNTAGSTDTGIGT